jgi:hypothetical protein
MPRRETYFFNSKGEFMNLFARLYKIDEERREIYARAIQEIPDNSGEIWDYASSVPEMRRWSSDMYAASGGQSLGNIRAMHSNVAAAKVTDIDFNDSEKAVDIVCKIVDSEEWSKVLQGVYTGMSIGGRYKRKWQDISTGKPVTRHRSAKRNFARRYPLCTHRSLLRGTQAQRFRGASAIARRRNFVDAMNKFQSLLDEANSMSNTASINAIRKIHAQGSRPLEKDFLHKYESDSTLAKNRTVQAIRKAHVAVRGNHAIDMDELRKMIRRNRLGKAAGLPPEDNDISGDGIANTGASNNWRDNPAPTTKPTRIGGQVIGVPSQTNMQAALDAIKQDWARGAKRMG